MSKYGCRCCGAEVPLGHAYCPNCLVTLLKPDDYEEVNDNGIDNSQRSDV